MMKKLKSYKLLLVGLLAIMQNSWAYKAGAEQVYSSASTFKAQVYAWIVSSGNDSDEDGDDGTGKPETVVAGQFSVSDDFEDLGKPPDIGC